MKSVTYFLATTCLASCLCTPASAAANDSGIYVSADYNYISTSIASVNGYGTGVGYKLNKYYSVELGYIGAKDGVISVNGGYLDLYGYVRLLGTPVSLFGTVGAEYATATYVWGVSGFGARVGGGLEYRISDSFAVRMAGRYQTAISNGAIASAGLTANL